MELRRESDLRDEEEQNSRIVNLEMSGLYKLKDEARGTASSWLLI